VRKRHAGERHAAHGAHRRADEMHVGHAPGAEAHVIRERLA
jgi:hypothetical protein